MAGWSEQWTLGSAARSGSALAPVVAFKGPAIYHEQAVEVVPKLEAEQQIDNALKQGADQERQRLARQGELPEALFGVHPESDVGVLIRAALTVAEEDAAKSERQRLKEALEKLRDEPGYGVLRQSGVIEALRAVAALDTLEADHG
jgi:hypothetical protein